MNEIRYTILEHIAVLSTSQRGWTKEINLVSWNDNAPKFDIRDWSPDHEKMSRGITLTTEEMKALSDAIKERGNNANV